MAIVLKPSDVPKLWEHIKWACVHADIVDESYREPYLLSLLCNLLSGRLVCLTRLDESRRVEMITVVEVIEDKLTSTRYLYIHCLYSFKKVDEQVWISDFEDLRKFAKGVGCTYIKANTVNEKASMLCNIVGMHKVSELFSAEV